jgi:hypothetical protein
MAGILRDKVSAPFCVTLSELQLDWDKLAWGLIRAAQANTILQFAGSTCDEVEPHTGRCAWQLVSCAFGQQGTTGL